MTILLENNAVIIIFIAAGGTIELIQKFFKLF